MIPLHLISFRNFFLSLLLSFSGISALRAQEAIVQNNPQVGYDSTVSLTILLKDLPPLTSPVKVKLSPDEYAPDFKIDSVTILNNSLLRVKVYTGTSIPAGFKTFSIQYGTTTIQTSTGILISGSRLQIQDFSPTPRRGYTQTCEFVVAPHMVTPFENDSILSITCYDDQGNIHPNIMCDSFQKGQNNLFSLNIHVTEAVHPGMFKLVIATLKNGILKCNLTIKPSQFLAVGTTRGSTFRGTLNYYDYARYALFQKAGPNSVKVYRNGVLRTDITIDSVKAPIEERLILYGSVSPNAEFGNYDIIVQNQLDTLSMVFTVYKPYIQSVSLRRIYRGDSVMKGITMQYANLNKGITTLSLLNPADSSVIRISNFTITNANNCKFLVQLDSLAPLGNYYFILTNSFDTISIIDSFYNSKGSIAIPGTPNIPSERQSVLDLQGTNTLFTHGPRSIWVVATTNGTVTVDSVAVLSNTKLKLWVTADAVASGNARFYYYSPMDDSILASAFNIVIKRPEAYFNNKKNINIGLKDTITLSIMGSSTHFKRLQKIRSTSEISGGIVYDSTKINVLGYTVLSDSLLSVSIKTNEDLFPIPSQFKLALLDSVSGELIVSNYLQFTPPNLITNYRNVIRKQATDTLWLPLSYFSESQIVNIDSIYFILNQQLSNTILVKDYSYKLVGNQEGILLNLEMNKNAKSSDYNFIKIIWNLNPGYTSQSNNIRIERPVFVSASIPRLTKDSISHCSFYFDGLYEDSVEITAPFNDLVVTNVQIKGDTVDFDARPIYRSGYISFSVITPNEGLLYDSVLFANMPVGIHEIIQSSAFHIYPIPAKNSITVHSSDHSMIQSIVIYDMLGKRYDYECANSSLQNLNIEGLSSGAYSMHIQTAEGIVIKKLIVE